MGSTTNLRTSLIMAVFLMAMACTAAGDVIYVDDDASLGGNGQNWATAYKYLQDALAVAWSGDEIRVAQGIYKPDRGGGNAPGNRYATFRLKNGVVITGGYAGFGQPDPDARDIEVYETILSGDLLGNDGPDFANNGENSYHVVTGSGTNVTAVLDGFTITAGNAEENQNVPRGCGGGMYNNYGSPTVTNCTFSRNWSGWDGGGMYNRDSSTPTVTNCTFIGNSAQNGGGLYNRGNSNSTITNCTFIGNSASGEGGGMTNYESSSPTLTNCTFNNNSAVLKAGGMYNLWQSSPTLTNCTFSGNSAYDGSGMYNYESSSPTLTNCTFRWNSASEEGGGMTNYDSSRPTLTNCTFSNNSAALKGGGMYNLWQSRPTLTNCTFSGNSAEAGGGMYNYDGSSSTLANCILWGNTPIGSQIYYDGTSSATVSYSDVQGGWPGIGNINADPLFVDPAIGDYHLLPGSPCIDTGDNSAVPPSVVTDLDGNYRIANGTVDMGVYEFGSTPLPSTLFVDARATGASNGSSWVDAFADVQEALTVAKAFPRVEEIRVAQGAYSPEGPLPDIRRATNPNPADGATGVSRTVDLSWTAGPDATSHDVYFGTSSPPPFIQNQSATTFEPGTIALGTRYYWRIDEVGAYGTITGTVWSFTTIGVGWSPPSPPPPVDRTATFQLINGVVIKGGYAGSGEPNADARDIELYETILSGDIGILGDISDNSYHVVTGSGTDETAVIDGFTITAGNADSEPYPFGGGMYNLSGSPTVTNCTFNGNSAQNGGGMHNESGSPTLTNCTFSGNSAEFGGGMLNYWNSSPTVSNCTFSGNSAEDGGGMLNWSSSSTATVTNCTFSGNSANRGGGMENSQGSPTVTNCTFSDNSANYGGGMGNYYSSPALTNCILWGNAAPSGPQIYNYSGGSVTVSYSDVQGGWPGQGNIDSDPRFVGLKIGEPPEGAIAHWKLDEGQGDVAYDSAGNNHGTIYGAQWTTGQIDGALSFDGVNDYVYASGTSTDYLQRLTICAWVKLNSMPLYKIQRFVTLKEEKAVLRHDGINGPRQLHFYIRKTNSTWGDVRVNYALQTGVFYHVAGTYDGSVMRLYLDGVEVGNSAVTGTPDMGNGVAFSSGSETLDGLLDEVAIYDRALSAEEIQQFYQMGYHLLPDSPCINAGDPDYIAEPDETDLDGKPRVIAGRIDMGAYEFNHDPIADAGPDQTVEAQAPWGATVTLDCSGSSDADSTPGTIDDINDFNWYQLDPCDPNFDVLLGTGRIIDCNLPIGEHIILLEVIDRAGASDTNEVTIIVQDTTPPDIICPPDVTLECPADTTQSSTGNATATDTCGTVTITHSDQWQPSCGNAGTLARTWTATDESGNSSTCVQIITVVDTTPPVITCPADVTLECPADTSVEANGSATAGDMCGSVTIGHNDLWQPSCGNTGTLARTWTATDECGNSSSCVQTLTVVDTTPPDFELSVSPTMLWPPDHKMVLITPSWTVSDKCDATPDVSLVGIVANEGDDTIGDGHTSNDIQIGEDGSIYLRSERSGTSDDRVYTITYQAVDDCGNAAVRSAAVSIPHDFRVLARIASRWLWAGQGRIPEDLNGDGVVNLKDIAIFANNWIR